MKVLHEKTEHFKDEMQKETQERVRQALQEFDIRKLVKCDTCGKSIKHKVFRIQGYRHVCCSYECLARIHGGTYTVDIDDFRGR